MTEVAIVMSLATHAHANKLVIHDNACIRVCVCVCAFLTVKPSGSHYKSY